MDRFRDEFGAKVIDLTENFRSSKASWKLRARLTLSIWFGRAPIDGEKQLLVGTTRNDEAKV